MTDQPTNGATLLSTAIERVAASVEWWKEDAPDPSELALPTRVLVALQSAGIVTVEQLKAAGPIKLRELPNIGKHGFDQIVALLRALDRDATAHPRGSIDPRNDNGASHDHEQGEAGLR